MTDDNPQQPICVFCQITGSHHLCVSRWSDRWCECARGDCLERLLEGGTMTTPGHVLQVAEAEVGYIEGGGSDGHSGNVTKFWQELDSGLQGQPWCAAFVRWTDKHAGGPLLPISNPYYCPSIVTYAKQHGLWSPDSGEPGDYVLYDFNGHGIAEHIGRLRKPWRRGQTDSAVEGNTSPDILGSQANGGGVYNKARTSGLILGCVRYSKLLQAGKPAPKGRVKHNPNPNPTHNLKQGATGPQVRWIQWAVGVPVDGTFGPQTDHAVRLFQHYHALVVDGVVGPATRTALAHVTH